MPLLFVAHLSCAEREIDLATLLERHAEARGGAEAIEAVESLTAEVEITEPEFALSGRYVATRDGHVRVDVYDGPERVYSEALGPDGGWQMGADGRPTELSEEGEAALRRGVIGNLYGLNELAGLGFELRLVGRARRGGESYWEIEQVAPDGVSKRLFLDAESYLVAREIATAALHPDVDPTMKRQETRYADHAASGGVLFANRTETIDLATGEVVQTVVVTARAVNPPIDATRFRRPDPGE